MIYLDNAATTQMSKEAIEVYAEVAGNYYGNSNSLHDVGSTATNVLDLCREELAKLLHADHTGIFFTGGGSDGNILALQSIIEAQKHQGNHLITTHCEHSSILNLFERLEESGFEVTYLPVDTYGQIDLEEFKAAIRDTTILAAIQHANSEIGTIQPIEEIGEILANNDIIFHCDTVQTLGKIPINVEAAKIDSLSVSSHKVYGPKGVGAVYLNPKIRWIPQIPNTTHEAGFRPGTVNVPGIAAFITSAKSVCSGMIAEHARISELRDIFIKDLEARQTPTHIEGHAIDVLPHIVGMRVTDMEGQYAMLECNRYSINIATGSACQVGNQAPSKTIRALGRTYNEAHQFIRLSFGKHTTVEDIKKTAEVFQKITEQYLAAKGSV